MAAKLLLFAALCGAATAAEMTTITEFFVMQTGSLDGPAITASYVGIAPSPYDAGYKVRCAPVDGIRPHSAPCDYLDNAFLEVGPGGMTINVRRRSEIDGATFIDVTGSATCTYEGSGPTAARCEGQLVSSARTLTVTTVDNRTTSLVEITAAPVTEAISTSVANIAAHAVLVTVTGTALPTDKKEGSAGKVAGRHVVLLAGVAAVVGCLAML